MFVFVYLLYIVTFLIAYVFTSDVTTQLLAVDLFYLIMQIVFFYKLVKLWLKRFDIENIKDSVSNQISLPMSNRKTHMTIQSWIMILLIFFTIEISELYHNNLFILISTILFISLILMFTYPLLIESNYALKKVGYVRIVLFSIIVFLISYFFDYIYQSIINNIDGIPEVSINQSAIETLLIQFPFKTFISIVIVAPIVEEIVFRGLLFRTMVHRNRILAYIVTFLVFGLAHLTFGENVGGIIELIFLPIYGLSGLLFAYVYERTNCIYSSMLTHFFNNVISFFLILLT